MSAFLLYPRAELTGAAINSIGAGNSHMAAEGASPLSLGWYNRLASAYPGITFTNVGVGGQRIQTMIDNVQTQVIDRLVVGKENVVFGLEGGNEMSANGRDANAAYAKWVQWCGLVRSGAAAKGAALYLITMGSHPAGNAATPAETLTRINATKLYNDLLRAKWPTFCDHFVDVGALPVFKNLFDGGDYTLEAFAATGRYIRSDNGVNDRVHLNNTGHLDLFQMAQVAFHSVRRRAA